MNKALYEIVIHKSFDSSRLDKPRSEPRAKAHRRWPLHPRLGYLSSNAWRHHVAEHAARATEACELRSGHVPAGTWGTNDGKMQRQPQTSQSGAPACLGWHQPLPSKSEKRSPPAPISLQNDDSKFSPRHGPLNLKNDDSTFSPLHGPLNLKNDLLQRH